MAGERIASAAGARLVVEHEGPERLARLDAPHVPRLRRIARLLVVVAANDGELDRLAGLAPGRELLQGSRRATVGAVQEVAEEHDRLRARARDGAIQALDILRGAARWQRDSRLAEARGLAEVEVGDEQGL